MELGTQLFELPFQIEFKTIMEWKRAWKYVDNCWRLTSTNGNEIQYDCKLNHVSFSSSKGYRNTTLLKNTSNCPARMLVLMNGDSVCVQKTGTWETHSHSVDLLDQLKTNSFVRDYIRIEAKRGYDHKSIAKAFHKQFDVAAVGAKYVTLAKIRRYSSISTSSLKIDDINVKEFQICSVIVFANSNQLQHSTLVKVWE